MPNSILSLIEADFNEAYKAKNTQAVSLLRLIKSSIKNAEIHKKAKLSDEEILSLLQKEVKQREEAINQYNQGGRSDLAAKELQEIELINGYLPKQLSDTELRQIISSAIDQIKASGKQDFGKVMGILMPQIKGRASGNRVSKELNSMLS